MKVSRAVEGPSEPAGGRVLHAAVPTWPGPEPARLDRLRTNLASRFGDLPGDLQERLAKASSAEVERWEQRLHLVRNVESVCDPEWTLPVTLVRQGALLLAAIASPLERWVVALSFEACRDPLQDRAHIVLHVPWFRELPEPDRALYQLRRHGLAVLAAEDGELAANLHRAVFRTSKQTRVTSKLFTPLGGEVL